MKKTTIIMMALLAICLCTFTSCSKNDDNTGGDEPIEKTVTLSSVFNAGKLGGTDETLTAAKTAVTKFYGDKLSSYAKVSDSLSGLIITTTSSNLAKVKDILDGLDSKELSEKLDGIAGLNSCTLFIYEGETQIHSYKYNTVTYSPEGEWKLEKDGKLYILVVSSATDDEGNRKAVAIGNGTAFEGKLKTVACGRQCQFTSNDVMEDKSTPRVKLTIFFNEKDAFDGSMKIDGEVVFRNEKCQRFDLFAGSKFEFTAKIVDANNELGNTTVTEEDKALYTEGLKEASFTCDSYGFNELLKAIGSMTSASLIYDAMLNKHPELKDTHIGIEYTISVTKNGTTLVSTGTRTYFNGKSETL